MSKSLATIARHPARVAVVLALVMLTLGLTVVFGADVSGFEIEGDLHSGTDAPAGRDWAQGASSCGVLIPDASAPNGGTDGKSAPVDNPACPGTGTAARDLVSAEPDGDDDVFGTGDKETDFTDANHDKIVDDPTMDVPDWHIGPGNVPPQKDDFSFIYGYTDLGGANDNIYVAFERLSFQGDSHLSFEFDPAGTMPCASDPSTACPKRTPVGSPEGPSVLVSFDLANGGRNVIPRVFHYDTAFGPGDPVFDAQSQAKKKEYPWKEVPAAAAGIVTALNQSGSIPAGPWGSVDKAGDFRTEIPIRGFFEMSADMNDIGIVPSCPGVTNVWVKSRSSDEISSALKDVQLLPIDLTNCGKITVIKDAIPDDEQDFAYSTTGGLSPASFSLDDDGDPAVDLSDRQVYDSVVPGPYTVTETVPAGWDLTNLSCVATAGSSGVQDGSIPEQANITVAPFGEVTCTYENTKLGKIIIDKVTDPTEDPQLFDFNLSGGPDSIDVDFQLADLTTPYDSGYIKAGTYAAAETVPDGWDLTSATCDDSSPVDNISLQSGETVTCTFTDVKRGKIIIDKVTDPTEDPQLFDFNLSGGPDSIDVDFQLADLTTPYDSSYIKASTYAAAETVPDGWDLTALNCVETVTSNSSTNLGTATASITLDPGETVTCTYTDTKRGEIIIDKVTDPSADPTSFGFSLTGGPDTISQPFSLTDTDTPHNSGKQKPGSYSAVETVPAGWHLTDITCVETVTSNSSTNVSTGTASITLDPGETVTCTYTNERLFKLIVITCDTTDETLVDSTVDLDGNPATTGDTLETITVPPGFASEAELCGLGGASYDDLPEGTYTPSIELPDIAPPFPLP